MLQRQFASVAHSLALELKNKFNLKDFCGFVQLRSSYDFALNQTDFVYSGLLLDEEIHNQYKKEKLDLEYLRRIEKEYGVPNLWPYLAVDRIVMFNQLVREYPHNTSIYNHEEMLRILQVKIKALIKFIEEQKPDYLIFTAIGSVGALFLYQLARKKGLKVFIISTACISGRTVISENYDTYSWVDLKFKENRLEVHKVSSFYDQAKNYLSEFRSKPVTYSIVHNSKKSNVFVSDRLRFLLPKNIFQSLRFFVLILRRHFSSPDRFDYTYIHPWNYFKDRAIRKLRNLFRNRNIYDDFNSDKDYVFFPLHLEPEIALLLVAPFFTDQLNLIRQIAKSLPVGYELVVKDHPRMAEYRPGSYYKEIKKIPNVRLVRPDISSFKILEKAKLVTAITGTVGWEAAQLGIPVITFGHVFYNTLSFVGKCRALEDLPALIKEKINNNPFDEKELLDYLAAMFEESVDLDILYAWENGVINQDKRTRLASLAEMISRKLQT